MEAPGFLVGGYHGYTGVGHFPPENHFAIDDLLDFSNEDEIMNDAFCDNVTGNSTDSSTVTVVDSCNSSVSGGEPPFSGNFSSRSFADAQFSGNELCVPYEDVAELEWLSNFVDDSFSSDGLYNLPLMPAAKSPTDTSSSATETATAIGCVNNNISPIFPSDVSVPGKARSKRSRAAPCDWSSRLLVLSATTSCSDSTAKKTTATPWRKRESVDAPARKCLHCASEKTPQWRTGPMGPKTLCNACGVRYKSGRLVPEYRPAASPTFVVAKHSNSHRKVVELRRQKELQTATLLSQTSVFGVSNGDDYLINHQSGHDFRRII